MSPETEHDDAPPPPAGDEARVDAAVGAVLARAAAQEPPASASEPPAERQTTPFLVLQFFIFPMAIVAVCVAVFAIFGLIASEGKGPRDHLNELRRGGGMFNNKRWQAAFALAGALENQRDSVRSDASFAPELVAAFDESKQWDDALARRYLALALGRLGDARAVPALRRALQDPGAAADSATRIYAVWALGAIGDPAALPELLNAAAAEDAGLRKTGVYALGGFGDEASRAALARALDDGAEDVRWNAALALARRRDAAAAPVLAQMLDRAHLATVAGLSPEQADAAVSQAVAAAAVLGAPELRAALERVRDHDPQLKLRAAARRALEAPPARP
jgi:HEAT repeat protein